MQISTIASRMPMSGKCLLWALSGSSDLLDLVRYSPQSSRSNRFRHSPRAATNGQQRTSLLGVSGLIKRLVDRAIFLNNRVKFIDCHFGPV